MLEKVKQVMQVFTLSSIADILVNVQNDYAQSQYVSWHACENVSLSLLWYPVELSLRSTTFVTWI